MYHLQGTGLLFFSPILMLLIDFSSLTVLPNASSTMLNGRGSPWFIADRSGLRSYPSSEMTFTQITSDSVSLILETNSHLSSHQHS